MKMLLGQCHGVLLINLHVIRSLTPVALWVAPVLGVLLLLGLVNMKN